MFYVMGLLDNLHTNAKDKRPSLLSAFSFHFWHIHWPNTVPVERETERERDLMYLNQKVFFTHQFVSKAIITSTGTATTAAE